MSRRSKLTTLFVGAALFAASWNLPGGWIAGWLWPIPILVVALASSTRWAMLAAACSFFVGATGFWPIEREVLPLPLFVLAHASQAVMFAASVGVFRWMRRGKTGWEAWGFAASFTWMSALSAAVSPHGTWGLVVYAQTRVEVLQVLALGGPYLLLFMLALAPAVVAVLLVDRRREAAQSAALGAALVGGVFALGVTRMGNQGAEPPVQVGLVADDRSVNDFRNENPAVVRRVADAYAAHVEALAQGGAEVIVLPEKCIGVTPDEEAGVDTRLAAAAGRATLVVGLHGIGRVPRSNVARVYAEGHAVRDMRKRHLVPGWEDGYAPGPGPIVFPFAGTRLGLSICKDFDFLDTGRDLGRGGARLVLAPAWDFAGTEWLHANMARFRAIEQGFALVRCANEGRLDVWDDAGRQVASGATRGSLATLRVAVRPGRGATPYGTYGDWALGLGLMPFAFLLWRALGRGRAA